MSRTVKVLIACCLGVLMVGPVQSSLARSRAPGLANSVRSVLDQPLPSSARSNVTTALQSLGVGVGDAAAYGTGTVVHVDAVTSGADSLAAADVAFSGAAFATAAPTGAYANEMDRIVTPALGVNSGHGRGSGLELGLLSDPAPIIGDLAEATAPPSTEPVTKVVGPISVEPLAGVELLRGSALARSADQGCVLGSNLSYGLGSAAGVQLLDETVSTEAVPPAREVSQSTSRTYVTSAAPGRFGLVSQTRQTIAPVTLFKGTPAQFTIEVLGEWVLEAFADGATSSVHYGPNESSPETPVIRVLDALGNETGALTLQQLLEDDGLEITIPGVATISLGEDPRDIDGDGASEPVTEPTLTLAAVDVVRVKLLQGDLTDLRVGHMEAAVAVPAAGVTCPGLQVTQTVDPTQVHPGDQFTYTIVVSNPNDCTLTDVKVVETITGSDGVLFTALSPTTLGDIGPIGPGESKEITVKVEVPPGSAPGQLSAEAVVTGVCQPPADGPDAGASPVPLEGRGPVSGPDVTPLACVVPTLDGLTLEQAKAKLEAAGCTVGKVTQQDATDPSAVGKVTDQTPDAGTQLPLRSPVDVVIGGPVCIVPSLAGLTPDQAKTELEEAGCKLGTITTDNATNPDNTGKVVDQTPDAGGTVPVGTTVDLVVGGPVCIVPDLGGLSESEARSRIEGAGCIVGSVKPQATGDPAKDGKVLGQGPDAGKVVPTRTAVDIEIGSQALDGTRVAGSVTDNNVDGAAAGSGGGLGSLAATGGVALAGLALLLVGAGLAMRVAGRLRAGRSRA